MHLGDDEGSDLFHLLCGELIGEGQYRRVYSCHLFEDCVVKRDTGANFSNISEWDAWQNLTSLRKWLAPVEWISPRGLWLIQKRTKPVDEKKLPKRVPEIFSDLKPSNWGVLDGRPVCHDYGNHAVYVVARKSARLKAAKWGK